MKRASKKFLGGIATILVLSFVLTHQVLADETVSPPPTEENLLNDDSFPSSTPQTAEITVTSSTTDTVSSTAENTSTLPTSTLDVVTTTTTTTATTTTEVVDATTAIEIATTTPTSTDSNTSGSGGINTTTSPSPVDQNLIQSAVNKILNFFKNQQSDDGMIIDGPTSEWVAMSLGANNIYSKNVKKGNDSLLDYLKSYDLSGSSELNYCASYPRHALGLMAGGFNPNQKSITDLNNEIKTRCVKDEQFGLRGINDDIFGLFSLVTGGETNSDSVDVIIRTVIADQQADGSFTWDGWSGADITGAAINALKYAENHGKAVEANIYTNAKNYLKNTQLNDGGWGFGSSDALTTSWAMMGINALGENQNDWFNSVGKNPWHVMTGSLVEGTNSDGYYTSSFSADGIDWFGTKHAVPALLGKSWPIILTDSSLTETVPVPNVGGGNFLYNPVIETTTTTPTSTVEIIIPTSTPTTTLDMVTSTPTTTVEMDTSTSTESRETTTTPPVISQPIKYIPQSRNINKQPTKETVDTKNILGEKIATDTQQTVEEINNTTSSKPEEENRVYHIWIKRIFFASIATLIILGLYITIKFRDKSK